MARIEGNNPVPPLGGPISGRFCPVFRVILLRRNSIRSLILLPVFSIWRSFSVAGVGGIKPFYGERFRINVHSRLISFILLDAGGLETVGSNDLKLPG
jgi:hypothetical protein